MRRVQLIFLALCSIAMVSAAIAAVVLPGPQHMFCPSCHGLERIANNLYVDAAVTPRQRPRIVAAIDRARRRVTAFFGPLRANPRIVVCRRAACAHTFGGRGAKGVAYGWHAVLLVNSRIFTVIAAHELAHIELHWRMGLWGWLRGTVPAWFDEGLATLISDDPRFRRDAAPQAVREIMGVGSYFGQWSAHARRVGWRTAYSAALTRVRQLERRIGREGLKRFVARLVREGNIGRLMSEAQGDR